MEAERVEITIERATARRVLVIAGIVEVAMIALDLYTARFVFPRADAATLVGLRCLTVAVCGAGYVAAGRLGSLFALRRLVFVAFAVVACLISLQAREEGGLASRYLHGVWLVALYYVTAFPMPWRAAAPRALAIIAIFPVVLGAAVPFDARLAAQWANAPVRAVFIEEYFFVIVAVALSVTSSHATWRARRAFIEDERRRALEREREEMTMELHDGVSAALQRALALVESSGERSGLVLRESIEDGLREARAMMSLLAAGPAPWRDVVAVARREMEDACERAGVAVRFEASDDETLVAPTLAHDVCRIVREAATNVVRHSRATQVTCVCAVEGRTIRLMVEDDGQGLARAGGGRGLHIATRRARRHAGDLHISNRTGSGVVLRATLSLDEGEARSAG